MAGRIHEFDRNPDALQQFAELYASGASRAEMAEVFGVHVNTISDWTKRPDVQALVSELRQRQVNRILRIVNSQVLAILEDEERRKKLDLKEILAIKKEYTPHQLEVGRSGDFDRSAAEAEAWAALDSASEAPQLPETVDGTVEEAPKAPEVDQSPGESHISGGGERSDDG